MYKIFSIIGLPENKIWKWLNKLINHWDDFTEIHCFKNSIFVNEKRSDIGFDSNFQPIFDINEKIGLIKNGEIYNISNLTNKNIFTNYNIILYLYKKYGVNFLKTNYINGMYAFILYDQENDIYLAARDPIGIIPLYIGYHKKGYIFISSEMKNIQNYCTHFEIFQPGYYFTCDSKSKIEFVKFYNSSWFLENTIFPTCSTYQFEIKNKLCSVIKQYLSIDNSFGLLLTDDLNSSLIASVACKEYKKIFPHKKIKSFNIKLENSSKLNYATIVADFINSEHFSFSFSNREGIEAIEDVIYHLETFNVAIIRKSIPLYILSKKINDVGCKIILSGDGADEIFGGFSYLQNAPNEIELYKEIIRKLKNFHKYNSLFSKIMSTQKIEIQFPFLDREYMEFVMSINPKSKMQNSFKEKIENFILRQAFNDLNNPFLPKEILWQKKQIFDEIDNYWIKVLKQHAENTISDQQIQLAYLIYPNKTPKTKEEFLYRSIFYKFYPHSSAIATVPKQNGIENPSGEAIKWK